MCTTPVWSILFFASDGPALLAQLMWSPLPPLALAILLLAQVDELGGANSVSFLAALGGAHFFLSRSDNGRTAHGMHVITNNADIQKKREKTKQSGAKEFKSRMTSVMNANDNKHRGSNHPFIADVISRKALSLLVLNTKDNEHVERI